MGYTVQMKMGKLISIFLLMALSFSTMHAFAINFLESDHCSVSEYVQETEHASEHKHSGDSHDIHHAFHVLFVLPESMPVNVQRQPVRTELSSAESYTFYLQNNVLQPPITLL